MMADPLGNVDSSINYWPAYLDALVNILIALLFTLSVFAIFSSVLRVVAKDAVMAIDLDVFQQPDQSDLQVVKTPDVTEHALNFQKKNSDARALPAREQVTPDLAFLAAEKARLTKLIEEQERIQSELSNLPFASMADDAQARQSVAAMGVAINRRINVSRYPGIKLDAGEDKSWFPSEVLFEWKFPLNKTNVDEAEWLGDREIINTLSSANYELISLIETGNPRQRRESYHRLMAVRSELLRQGLVLSVLNIRIISENRIGEVPISGASVFLVPVTGR